MEEKELRPTVDIPLWEPKSRRAGKHTMSAAKAVAAGITFKQLEQTFDDALRWYDHVKSPEDDPGLDKSRPFNGITRARELELLEAWEKVSEEKMG